MVGLKRFYLHIGKDKSSNAITFQRYYYIVRPRINCVKTAHCVNESSKAADASVHQKAPQALHTEYS